MGVLEHGMSFEEPLGGHRVHRFRQEQSLPVSSSFAVLEHVKPTKREQSSRKEQGLSKIQFTASVLNLQKKKNQNLT